MSIKPIILLCGCLAFASCETLIVKAIDKSPKYVTPLGGKTVTVAVEDRNPSGPEIYELWITHIDRKETTSFTRGVKNVAVTPEDHEITVEFDSVFKPAQFTSYDEYTGFNGYDGYIRSRGTDRLKMEYKPGRSYLIVKDQAKITIKEESNKP
jgi:hypothetical protein